MGRRLEFVFRIFDFREEVLRQLFISPKPKTVMLILTHQEEFYLGSDH